MALKSILIAILTLLLGSGPAAAGWITEAVQQAGDVGSWSSIAVGADDTVHISYYEANRHNLRYAKKAKNKWKAVNVDRPGDVGWSNALALKYNGEPSIAYSDFTRGAPSFASRLSDNRWHIGPMRDWLDSKGGIAPSLVFDFDGRGHILHQSFVTEIVLWHTTSDGAWPRVALSSQSQLRSSSLAIDGNDTLHAAWMDFCPPPFFDCDHRGSQQWVVHATRTGLGGVWEIELVRSVGAEGISCSSIAVDAHGIVHIVYVDRGDGSLNYESNATGQWKPRVLYNQSWVTGASMKLDLLGNLHVSYSTGDSLKYATNKSGVWVHETVDAARTIGRVNSIAIDRFGKPHISYYDSTAGDLRHAFRQ